MEVLWTSMTGTTVSSRLRQSLWPYYMLFSDVWTSHLTDTDNTLISICEACVSAGPQRCALYEPTAERVLARVNTLLEKLKSSPIAVYNASSASKYGVLDYRAVKFALFQMLYTPYHGRAAVIARGITAAEKGDGRLLFESMLQLPRFSCECPSPQFPRPDVMAAYTAINCADRGPVHDSNEELQVRTVLRSFALH